MSNYAYQRLSALDTSFLALEDDNTCMHMAATSIFDAGPLRTAEGGIDFERIERLTEGLLSRMPRYRQKLEWIPFQNHPVWVDDTSFNLHYHLRHTGLPRPGTIRQLKRLTARIVSQPLDRAKPLWETWVVEGLEGDRFAMITKVHHCMIDGVGGVNLGTIMMSDDPSRSQPEQPHAFVPRPSPSRRTLLFDEFVRRAQLPFRALARRRSAGPGVESAGPQPRGGESASSGTLGSTLGAMFRRASRTPLNAPIGPHRRFDWTVMELEELKEVGKALGGSINDVVLATVAGAVRRFFQIRGVDPDDIEFRALTPVNVRGASDTGKMGNRISAWVVDLPIAERDPRARFEALAERTRALKSSNEARGGEALIELTEWLPGALFALAVRTLKHALPFNIVITNVPGIQKTGYLLGAELLETYGLVPLAGNLGLGIAIQSYNNRAFWGFNADWETVPDLHDFVLAIENAFEKLRDVAGLGPPPASPAA